MSDTDDDGLYSSAMDDTDDDGSPPSYSKVTSKFTNDLRNMINDPDYSNVVFICKDGTRVHGCSFLLAARNNFFRGMFLSGLAESQQSEISLPEISATGLLAMMEMLYTGSMDKYRPKLFRDCKAICETIVAAKYFLIEVHLWLDLQIATEWAKDDIQSAVKNYSIVVEYALKYGEPFSLVSRYLAGMLVLAPLKPEHLQTLSGDAVLHLLKVTETTGVESETNPHVLARTELGRFRTMVLWCACKEFSSECVTTPLPFTAISQEIACTLKLFERSSKKRKHVIREQQDMYNKIKSRLAQAVRKYLPLVNYRHFAPDDLLQIVAPMEIVPHSDIKAATQFQKLRTPVKVEMQTLGWLTDPMYKVSEDGCRIQQHKSGEGYAIHKLCAISKAGGFYEWEICIEEVCHSYTEVGLLYSRDVHDLSRFEQDSFSHPRHEFALRERSPERSTLRESGVPLSTEFFYDAFAFRMDNTAMSIHNDGLDDQGKSRHGKRRYGKDCSRLVYGKHYAHKNSKVKISLDMSKAECSISVDNEHFGVAWTGLRAGVYQPAVSLGDRPSGAVRIKVLRIGQWDFTS